MRMGAVLTVSESKRLVAKGVAALDCVQRALKEGVVNIAKGTTNAYVVEEILGKEIDKAQYCTGTTWPAKAGKRGKVGGSIPDVVLVKGEPVEGVVGIEYIQQMKEGDVFIKGANAVNHALGQAGILIGHSTGGTIGATWGTITARRIRLVVPVGLEKGVPASIQEVNQWLATNEARKGNEPAMFPVFGDIVTEIEAIEVLTGARAMCVAAGGIGGAEGSIRLSIDGTKEQLDACSALLDGIYGEPPFVS